MYLPAARIIYIGQDACQAHGMPVTKAANMLQGKTSSFAGLPATPFSMGSSQKTAGGLDSK